MCDDDEGPCPKCKATVRLGDLTPISEGTGSGSSAGGDGSNSEEHYFLVRACMYHAQEDEITRWRSYELYLSRYDTGWGIVPVGLRR